MEVAAVAASATVSLSDVALNSSVMVRLLLEPTLPVVASTVQSAVPSAGFTLLAFLAMVAPPI